MKSFKLDSNGDIIIRDNELIMTEDDMDELAQSVWITLSTNLNEWFLNTKFGLNYDIFMDNPSINFRYIENAIEHTILQDKRIKRVDDIHIDFNKIRRRITVDVTIVDYDENIIDIKEVIRVE